MQAKIQLHLNDLKLTILFFFPKNNTIKTTIVMNDT